MSQLIACQNVHGIVLAVDSKAVEFDADGNLNELRVERMVQLGPHAAIVTGGAAAGSEMARALQTFVREEGLTDIQDIYTAALPFLGSEYERFLRKKCQDLHLDPLLHVYFILAGHTARDPQRPMRAYFLWTKRKLPQLDGDEIDCAYAVPRRMALEYKLNRLCKENATLEAILDKVRGDMEALGRDQEEVGGPFSYATINSAGFRKMI